MYHIENVLSNSNQKRIWNKTTLLLNSDLDLGSGSWSIVWLHATFVESMRYILVVKSIMHFQLWVIQPLLNAGVVNFTSLVEASNARFNYALSLCARCSEFWEGIWIFFCIFTNPVVMSFKFLQRPACTELYQHTTFLWLEMYPLVFLSLYIVLWPIWKIFQSCRSRLQQLNLDKVPQILT